MPHTSLSAASVLAMPWAIRPAGPVMRTFSPLNMGYSSVHVRVCARGFRIVT